MSKSKTSEFTLEGITEPLQDGQPRKITLVAVLETSEDTYKVNDYEQRTVKGKHIRSKITRDQSAYDAKLSIGLAVCNPVDAPSPVTAYTIAKGRAVKPGAELVTLRSDSPFFGHGEARATVAGLLQKIQQNPNKYIKVSAKKAKPVTA